MAMFKNLASAEAIRSSGNSLDSNIELMKFYMVLANKGAIKLGSSGFNRLIQIKNRVKKHENAIKKGRDEYGKSLKALQKSVKYRAYVGELVKQVDAKENSLTTN